MRGSWLPRRKTRCAILVLLFVVLLIERGIRMAPRGHVGALALIPLLAYLGQSLVGVNEVVVDWVFWSSAGIIAATGAQTVRRPRAGWPMPRDARALGVVAVASAVVLIVVTMPSRILAGEALLRTESFSTANRTNDAIAFGQNAISADARRAETWSSYGSALTNAGNLTAAVASFEAAAVRQPWQPQNWKNLAIVWLQLGNRGAAQASAERILRSDPFDGDAHEFIANIAFHALRDHFKTKVTGQLQETA